MKKYLLAIFIFSVSGLSGQNLYHPWFIEAGTNFVDFQIIEKPFVDHFQSISWNQKNGLSKVRFGRMVNNSFTLSGYMQQVTMDVQMINAIPLQKTISDEHFRKVGCQVEYKFANGYILKEDCILDPYILLGTNGSTIDDITYLGQSAGFGINIWPTDKFGINAEVSYNYLYDFNDYANYNFGLVVRFGNMADKDKDQIPDIHDKCPDMPGTDLLQGCPDSDGDGIPDNLDICPKLYGSAATNGCPDDDNDRTKNSVDECPYEPGPPEFKGCPDFDRDSVPDHLDKCPTIRGAKENDGCPPEEKIRTNENLGTQVQAGPVTDDTTGGIDYKQEKPDTLQSAIPQEQPQPQQKKYYIIAGSFKSYFNAEKRKNNFIHFGFKPEILGREPNGNFRVAIKNYTSLTEASSDLKIFKKDFDMKIWLILR
ncbi:MAG: hypothetical protein B6I19_07905 [Bacteroidetes bacterium 4572_114]|nr:MAG: hypothetical protein B6I19_07905 [Bacteroidetes bacterium 4572_114]